MRVVSINGRDGVGKSEQVSLLGNDAAFRLAGSLVDYSDKWVKLSPIESFNWWFRDLPFRNLVSIILESLAARRAGHKADMINVNDRGSLMFKAVCAATLVTREQISDKDALAEVDGLFKDELRACGDELDVLLKSNPAYHATLKPILQLLGLRDGKHLPWQTEMYARYQVSLAHFMEHYFRDVSPERVICVDSCILDTHTKLQVMLNRMYGINLEPVCGSLEKLVAFGGLSECGKSSFAEQLSVRHQFCRLKIKYFGEVLRSNGVEVKPVPLGREILRFLRNHKHVTKASIESLHGPDLPAYLKLLFGPRLSIVYLDTPENVRVGRTMAVLGMTEGEAASHVGAKDSVKLASGADKVKNIADVVFNNGNDDFETAFRDFVGRI